jgi:hypothetical protein
LIIAKEREGSSCFVKRDNHLRAWLRAHGPGVSKKGTVWAARTGNGEWVELIIFPAEFYRVALVYQVAGDSLVRLRRAASPLRDASKTDLVDCNIRSRN